MTRPIAAIDAELALKTHQAARLPRWHPDYAPTHAAIDVLLAEREQAGPLRPSQVLAKS